VRREHASNIDATPLLLHSVAVVGVLASNRFQAMTGHVLIESMNTHHAQQHQAVSGAATWPDRSAQFGRQLNGWWLQRLPLILGILLALLGFGAVVTLTQIVPPFQNPDELAHLLRAEQIEHGGLIGRRFLDGATQLAGGRLDSGAGEAYLAFGSVMLHPETPATRDMFERADAARWGGPRHWQMFPNTALYPPFLYLPAAAAIGAGRIKGLSVTHTLRLARLINGVSAVVLAGVTVSLAAEIAPLLFALLALPMSLSLMSSVSQDALLLPVCALATTLLFHMRNSEVQWGRAGLILLCTCLSLVAMARPVYLPAAVLPLTVCVGSLRGRVLGAMAVVVCMLVWSAYASHYALTNMKSAQINPSAQLILLGAAPWKVWRIALATYAQQHSFIMESFIGRLGWLDVELPVWVHVVAVASLLLAVLVSARPYVIWQRQALVRAVDLGVALTSSALVFAVEYVTWTPVGQDVVEGVQGRYFLPVMLLLCASVPRRTTLPRVFCLLLPISTAAILGGVFWAVVERYYLR